MNYERARKRMVDEQLIPRGIMDKRILDAIGKVPRHIFIEEAFWDRAYGDHALPIGERQSISQPYMVALMTEALELTGTERVLEIGTGSGYQTAILAELAAKVYSIERIKVLAHRARMILDGLNYLNIVIKVFDGTYGWPDEAPFDAIIVTAGAPAIPQAYIEQLKEGGRIIIPVGDRSSQVLKKGVKMGGGIVFTDLTSCIFVPLIGAFAWKKEEDSDRRNNN
ncbi:MAG: protein-L-isoaspartate(D-aspartate) O-methyltransferase [Nitrospirae bacterium]|nr:protein-L-isoaspartate(D-aspartate) O-methyltransferase [Nitrospirota bacterium]